MQGTAKENGTRRICKRSDQPKNRNIAWSEADSYVESLTGQRQNRVHTESQEWLTFIMTTGFSVLNSNYGKTDVERPNWLDDGAWLGNYRQPGATRLLRKTGTLSRILKYRRNWNQDTQRTWSSLVYSSYFAIRLRCATRWCKTWAWSQIVEM